MGKTAIPGASRAGGTIFTIAPEKLTIITDKNHPLYDPRIERRLTDEFIDSIVARGVIEAIILHKDGDKFVVTAGRRRTRGAIAANKILVARGLPPVQVPVRLRNEDDVDAFETNIITNAQREDDDVITNAENSVRYMRQFGRSEDQAAKIWGVKPATIKLWSRAMELVPEVRQAVREGLLSFHDAIKNLAGVSRSEQVAALARFIASSPTALRTANTAAEAAEGEDGDSEDGDDGEGGERSERAKVARPDSPLVRLRRLYRSEEALAALSPRERLLVEWVFGEVSMTELSEKNSELATALTRAKRKAGRKTAEVVAKAATTNGKAAPNGKAHGGLRVVSGGASGAGRAS